MASQGAQLQNYNNELVKCKSPWRRHPRTWLCGGQGVSVRRWPRILCPMLPTRPERVFFSPAPRPEPLSIRRWVPWDSETGTSKKSAREPFRSPATDMPAPPFYFPSAALAPRDPLSRDAQGFHGRASPCWIGFQ